MNETPYQWEVRGFRRYRPENRINRGWVNAAPWVSLALLVSLYLLTLGPNVLQPGILVNLAEAPFLQGSRYDRAMVVMANLQGADTREIVFYDDERFLVGDRSEMDQLKESLRRTVHEAPDAVLVIQADQRVRQGTLVQLMTAAGEAGIKTVNLATRASGP